MPITIVKEYVYCPRIAYFKLFTVFEPPTESMMYARESRPSPQDIHSAIKHMIRDSCSIEIERYVYSNSAGVHGYADAVALCAEEAIPIEVKLRSSPIAVKRFALHHIVQIVAYAIAVEETFKKPVYRAFILSLEPRTVFEVKISLNFRELVYRVVKELHKMVLDEEVPRPTPSKAKCGLCFYRGVCVR
ncbi:MAG: CRISPR-associated protein Cas4 [Ignisphaera sp.]